MKGTKMQEIVWLDRSSELKQNAKVDGAIWGRVRVEWIDLIKLEFTSSVVQKSRNWSTVGIDAPFNL